MVFDDTGTYTDSDTEITSTRTYEWNHGVGEIVTALLDHGLTLTTFHERAGSSGRCSRTWCGNTTSTGRPPAQRDMVPLMYTLIARAPG